jgi:hypothetical protein
LRRVPLAVVMITAAAAVVVHAATRAPVQRIGPPNILLIQADDLGYGDLSVYGQTHFATPNLDRLAREGTRFTQYYAGSTVCAPSRGALMTGKHTGHGAIRGNGSPEAGDVPLPQQEVTIAEVLKAAGYRTAIIGKWGLGQPGSAGTPDKQGFDYAFGFLDQRHAHRQFTDHLWRNGEMAQTDLEHDYVNDLFTKEAAGIVERLGHPADARSPGRCARANGARRGLDGECAPRKGARGARPTLLGVSRVRIPAGGADRPLEGSPIEAGGRRWSCTTWTRTRTRPTTWPPRTPTSSSAWTSTSSRHGRNRSAGRGDSVAGGAKLVASAFQAVPGCQAS